MNKPNRVSDAIVPEALAWETFKWMTQCDKQDEKKLIHELRDREPYLDEVIHAYCQVALARHSLVLDRVTDEQANATYAELRRICLVVYKALTAAYRCILNSELPVGCKKAS